jgi:hypothetical protein
MGFDWLKLDNRMVDHPKTHALAAALGEPLAGWYVIRLWSWATRYAPRGQLPASLVPGLESALGWQGEKGLLLLTLVKSGLLDSVEGTGGFEIHDWWDTQSAHVVKAEKDSQRRRKPALAQRLLPASTALDPRLTRACSAGERRGEEKRRETTLSNSDSTSAGEVKIPTPAEQLTLDGNPPPLPEPEALETPAQRAQRLLDAAPDGVFQVFEHWRQACGHQRAKLDPKRRRLIENALKLYSVADLQRAISGCAVSAWHQGVNDKHQKYNDLELILRDAKHIESFLERDGTHE